MRHTVGMATHLTARARARAEITAEILDEARRQLAVEGAAGLSLRSIARQLGMVSSAIYRYVDSRDELLTRLIVEAYESLGSRCRVRRRGQCRATRCRTLGRHGGGDPRLGPRPATRVHAALRVTGAGLRRTRRHGGPGHAGDAGAALDRPRRRRRWSTDDSPITVEVDPRLGDDLDRSPDSSSFPSPPPPRWPCWRHGHSCSDS